MNRTLLHLHWTNFPEFLCATVRDSERFRFHQIHNFLHKICSEKPTPPRFTPYEQWCGQTTEQRGGISIIYQSLAHQNPIYGHLGERHLKGIRNISLIESNLKVMTSWYLTPAKLAKMYPTTDPRCFRGCQLTGSTAHIWWECP